MVKKNRMMTGSMTIQNKRFGNVSGNVSGDSYSSSSSLSVTNVTENVTLVTLNGRLHSMYLFEAQHPNAYCTEDFNTGRIQCEVLTTLPILSS